MNPDELHLRNLLADLCLTQADMTYWNVKGPKYDKQTLAAVGLRNKRIEAVVAWVMAKLEEMS